MSKAIVTDKLRKSGTDTKGGMRLVLPGQEALEVLERAGTTKDECTLFLKQILAEEDVQLCVFKTRVSPETITLSDDPQQQGAFSFTYYIAVNSNNQEQ